MARYDNLPYFCSPYYVMFIADVLISQIFWLFKIDVHYMILCLQYSLIQSQSIYFSKFPRGMPPDPPNISMLCMLIVLHTIKHTITHLQNITLWLCASNWGAYSYILGSYSLSNMCSLPGGSYRFAPLVFTSYVAPLGQNPKINPEEWLCYKYYVTFSLYI